MDKHKMKYWVIGIVLILAMAVGLIAREEINAAGPGQCLIVSIEGRTPSTAITPATTLVVNVTPKALRAPVGSCVVWVTWQPVRSEVRISFKQGETCQAGTSAPSGFKMEAGCYLTDYLPLGGTSSLVFEREGTYSYEIVVAGRAEKVAGGEIVVYKPAKK